LTSTADDAKALLTSMADSGKTLRVLLHTTFAPEVLWAQQQIDDLIDRHGPVATVASVFHDAYRDDLDRRTASLASSWLDSGINAVSVLWRLFVLGDLLDASGRDPLWGEARLRVSRRGHDSVASISTSWDTSDGHKSTTIKFDDEWSLVLDHSEATASIFDARSNTETVHQFGRAALDARYRTMFDAYLKRSQLMPGAGDIAAMHRLLFDAQGTVEAGRDTV
jgi:predicted dehydrogenase